MLYLPEHKMIIFVVIHHLKMGGCLIIVHKSKDVRYICLKIEECWRGMGWGGSS
jgi:hypothetical protein